MSRAASTREFGHGQRLYPQLEWLLATGARHLGDGDWLPILVEYDLAFAPRDNDQEGPLEWFAGLSWLGDEARGGVLVPAIFRNLPEVVAKADFPFCTLLIERKRLEQVIRDAGWNRLVLRAEPGPPLDMSEAAAKSAAAGPTAADPLRAASNQTPLVQKLLDLLRPLLGGGPGGGPSSPTPAITATRPVLTAVLDEGIAFAHERFRSSSGTRIAYFWNQDGRAGPAPFGMFGTELTAADIDNAVLAAGTAGEDAVYRSRGELNFAADGFKAIAHRRSHGTHVLDLAAGADPKNAPPQRPIIAVELPSQAIADTTGTQLTPYKLIGFLYVLLRAQTMVAQVNGTLPVVINLSYGRYSGAQDGSGMVERLVDLLIELCRAPASRTPLRVVLAAGNHRAARVHAHFKVSATGTIEKTLHWRLLPDDRTPSFLQIWLPRGVGAKVSVTLTPPGMPAINVSEGQPKDISPGPAFLYGAVYVPETATERAHVEIRVEPTAPAIALDSTQPTVPPGIWLITVKHEAGPRLVIDAFIERDDTLRGRRSMGRQSYFDDPRYKRRDDFGRVQEFDPSYPSSYVVRRGTLNGDASGKESYVIGGFRRFPQSPKPAPYTSAGPIAPSATRSMRAPNWLAPSDDSPSCLGVLAAGTRSGVRVAMSGTSVAAPQAARYFANEFAAGRTPDTTPPTGLSAVSNEVPAADRPLVAGDGAMNFPGTRGRP